MKCTNCCQSVIIKDIISLPSRSTQVRQDLCEPVSLALHSHRTPPLNPPPHYSIFCPTSKSLRNLHLPSFFHPFAFQPLAFLGK